VSFAGPEPVVDPSTTGTRVSVPPATVSRKKPTDSTPSGGVSSNVFSQTTRSPGSASRANG
jgi:hypothetical protein